MTLILPQLIDHLGLHISLVQTYLCHASLSFFLSWILLCALWYSKGLSLDSIVQGSDVLSSQTCGCNNETFWGTIFILVVRMRSSYPDGRPLCPKFPHYHIHFRHLFCCLWCWIFFFVVLGFRLLFHSWGFDVLQLHSWYLFFYFGISFLVHSYDIDVNHYHSYYFPFYLFGRGNFIGVTGMVIGTIMVVIVVGVFISLIFGIIGGDVIQFQLIFCCFG